jgi:leucyl-tRNA synthetase
MDFDFGEVEKKWRKEWEKNEIYKVSEDPNLPKYYVLDMFPYPSGAGLHVGHPLGYVASDIFARYKRLRGFNVLHPMGYDAFGLPAEQYAIETGTPPQVTTDNAIKTYRSQMDKIGFSYDWSRQVKTCDPQYYKWTQWIFLQLFNSWYNRANNKAENIFTLETFFAENGCINWPQHDKADHDEFTDAEWNNFSVEEQQKILMRYRIAYQSYSEVNWCEALGTVLANDEVKDGKSERGGHPVERRRMRQWFLRITEYADRLLAGLDTLDWSEAMKDMQRNWIGRSEGALIRFLTPGPSPKERGENSRICDAILTPDPSPRERGGNSQTASGETYDAARFMTGDKETAKKNLEHAKQHRKEPTEAEDKLWQEIRNEKLGFKFRRQHLIDKYIVDFVCLFKGLVVEVDGDIHELPTEDDEIRTLALNQHGFTVIRFTNDEVFNDIQNVLKKIKPQVTKLQERSDSPITNETPKHKVAVSSPLLRRGAGGEDNVADMAVPPLSFGEGPGVRIFTTRPDTIFGATFMVIAPEHELVASLTTPAQQKEIDDYIAYVKSRTDVERQQEKKVTGAFTGSYAVNPFTYEEIPIYIAEYVLAGYGTGAIMAVPADDERDRKFAEKFGLPIIEVIDKSAHPNAGIGDKVGTMINSGILNGKEVKDAIKTIIDEIEDMEIGKRKVNYRLRDAGFSRQRYWGEPFPIVYKNDVPYPLSADELPLLLPRVDSYKPSGDGRSPIANNKAWVNLPDGSQRETDTMPGYAGSSWYFLRYMDPHNNKEFAAKDKLNYWQSVDLYLGGNEHAVGHLLYARLWHKFLYDMGYVPTDEPFKKLVNQGMIQGVSALTKGLFGENNDSQYIKLSPVRDFSETNFFEFVEENIGSHVKMLFSGDFPLYIKNKGNREIEMKLSNYHVPISSIKLERGTIDDKKLNIEAYIKTDRGKQHQEACFVTQSGFWHKGVFTTFPDYIQEGSNNEFIVEREVEKMSKSKYNVVNPDDVIEKYGADCFRMFEMFLGPLEQSKPWDDKGIDGVGKFIRRFWRLFYDDKGTWRISTDTPTAAEYKSLHKTLKKIAEDIERLQFNTCVSQFMICLNELTDLKCTKREILEPLLIALAPFAPFLTEELWQALGHIESIHKAAYPKIEEKYLVESSFNYPVSINGKTRAEIPLALDLDEAAVRATVMSNETILKWTNGSEPKKFIFVKGRIINVVV